MEKETYAKGDSVYISASYPGRCSGVFGIIDRPAGRDYDPDVWMVFYAERNHPVPARFIEFKEIKPVAYKPRFKRGDRVLSRCPGNETKNKLATVLELKLKEDTRELYLISIDEGKELTMSLGWLQPAPEEGPTYVKGDRVEITTPWSHGKIVRIEKYNGVNESGEFYDTIAEDGEREIYSIHWMKDVKEETPKRPDSKYKVGDTLVDNNEFTYPKVEVIDISDFPNENGWYVYLVRQGVNERWVSEHWLEPDESPAPVKPEVAAVDRLRIPILRQIAELKSQLEGLDQVKAALERK